MTGVKRTELVPVLKLHYSRLRSPKKLKSILLALIFTGPGNQEKI
jgi:hypothetical protein